MDATTEWLQMLWAATLAVAVVAVVLLVLPQLLRRRFGAGVAYAAWWLLPATWIASLLPARVIEYEATASLAQALPLQAIAQPISTVPTAAGAGSSVMWLAAWFLGAMWMAWRLWRQQRRFEMTLGELQPLREGLWQAQARHGLPALLGVLRARIVLPSDFDQRYNDDERSLMLAHERLHWRRGDHLANLAAAIVRCVFWFNPLVHVAAARFRHDQELACDQAVVAAHPDSRRAYGEAMLKTLMADRQAPLGCHWGLSHPLKERIMQLKLPTPRTWARRVGVVAVALLTLGAGFAAWSAKPARSPSSSVAGDIGTAGETVPGVRFDSVVERQGRVIASPSVWVPFGHEAVIEVPDGVRVVVTAAPPVGDVSKVTADFYYFSKGTWVLDRNEWDEGRMSMPARIDLTPSFQRSLSDGVHRLTVMPRKANRPATAGARANGKAHADFHADIKLRLDNGETKTFAIEDAYGKSFVVVYDVSGSKLDAKVTIEPHGDTGYLVNATLVRDGEMLGNPRLIAEAGKPAKMVFGSESDEGVVRQVEFVLVMTSIGEAMPPSNSVSVRFDPSMTFDPTPKVARFVYIPSLHSPIESETDAADRC